MWNVARDDLGPEGMQRLRGHHLVCLHFFCGGGYNAPFIENLRNILESVEKDGAEICINADSVCIKCPHLHDGVCLYNEDAEGDIRRMDQRALSLLNLSPGTMIRWQKIREGIPEIFHEWHITECIRCDWSRTCEKNSLYQQLLKKE